MSQKNRVSLISVSKTLVEFGGRISKFTGMRENLHFYVQGFCHRTDFSIRKGNLRLLSIQNDPFGAHRDFYYAFYTYRCHPHCIQTHTRHLQLTRLSEGYFNTSHLSCKVLRATSVQEAHLSCFAKALLLVLMKTKHNKTPTSFSTSFSFQSFQPFSCFTLEISLVGFHVSCLHHFLCISHILSISPLQVA